MKCQILFSEEILIFSQKEGFCISLNKKKNFPRKKDLTFHANCLLRRLHKMVNPVSSRKHTYIILTPLNPTFI